jgi:opacity protein-like surface antigen
VAIRLFAQCLLTGAMLLAAGASQAQLYWRVDGGWSMSTDANLRDRDGNNPFVCSDFSCAPGTGTELNEVGNSPVIQGGIGWRFSPNFRIDGTLGYRGFYELDDSDGFPSTFNADITSWALMANAYYDFNLAWGRPYLGAGLGVAVNKIDPISNTVSIPGASTFTLPGGTTTGVAWSIMAGVTFQLSPTMSLDVGYRYIDLGKIESDAGNATTTGPFVIPVSGLTGNLRAHELMVGLRF